MRALRTFGNSIALLVIASASLAQDATTIEAPEPTETSAEEQRHKRMRKLAEEFVVYTDDGGDERAQLLDEPIFRWSNPQREAIGGALFLWIHRGRPHATIGIWTYDDTSATDSYELQSMSERPFSTASNQRPWSPRTPGLEFRQLKLGEPPAASRARRLVQMRQLGRKHFSSRVTINSGAKEELRFLPAPVYRYKETPPGVMDGAMFSFAQGTDPEAFLILEAREIDGEQSWYYALGNQTSVSVAASINGDEVWNNRERGDSFLMVIRRP